VTTALPMKIQCVGGGPGGLLLALLARRSDPTREVVVHERNGPDDTFGFGVVFSDETLANLRDADPIVFDRIDAELRHWPDIEVRYRGRCLVSGGHGFSAVSRRRLLALLTERAIELGVDVRFRSEVADLEAVRRDAGLVVGSDGVNSFVRRRYAEQFRPTIEMGRSKFIWLGTPKNFERFVFLIAETEHGVVQAHVYPYSDEMSTFIVETTPDTWTALGFAETSARYTAPGENDAEAIAFAQSLFAEHLDGAPIVGNNSKWLEFTTVTNEHWHHDNVVVLGDAAHTAHFSIGSGTKLAMEDAIALAGALDSGESLGDALDRYEADRRPVVASTQRAAHTSRQWFEGIGRYLRLGHEQFAFQLLTRSQRITYENLRVRDAAFERQVLEAFWKDTPLHLRPDDPATPPMFYPFELRDLRLDNRVVVSPMAQYSAAEGMPDDWHLVHLGSRAVGGAGLVMTEMTCVSPEGRITLGCTGLWSEQQRDAWVPVVEFVHRQSRARIGLQIGHSGRKGACILPWEGDDTDPLPDPWELMAPSALPYRDDSPVPRAMTQADLDTVRDEFVRTAVLGAEAGFDLLELHMAHGYLLASFLTPLVNQRTDRYGGTRENRLRYPLEVLEAVRAVWPAERPISVRISATDWVDGGVSGDDAVEIARALARHGADVIDVSTGQTSPAARPRYGRLYQTPFSDRIRHEAGIPTMTVGNLSTYADANSILAAGRADLCVLARGHLYDPYWTRHAAWEQDHDLPWPDQYVSVKSYTPRQR